MVEVDETSVVGEEVALAGGRAGDKKQLTANVSGVTAGRRRWLAAALGALLQVTGRADFPYPAGLGARSAHAAPAAQPACLLPRRLGGLRGPYCVRIRSCRPGSHRGGVVLDGSAPPPRRTVPSAQYGTRCCRA